MASTAATAEATVAAAAAAAATSGGVTLVSMGPRCRALVLAYFGAKDVIGLGAALGALVGTGEQVDFVYLLLLLLLLPERLWTFALVHFSDTTDDAPPFLAPLGCFLAGAALPSSPLLVVPSPPLMMGAMVDDDDDAARPLRDRNRLNLGRWEGGRVSS